MRSPLWFVADWRRSIAAAAAVETFYVKCQACGVDAGAAVERALRRYRAAPDAPSLQRVLDDELAAIAAGERS